MPSASGVHLGCLPEQAVNGYRCGEKLILNQPLPADLTAQVRIDFLGDSQARDAGILFRTSGAAVGYDAQCGYFAGLIPRTGLVVLGRTDGAQWVELARASAKIDSKHPQLLRVGVAGDQITIGLNGTRAITAVDTTYQTGGIGLRVVNTHAVFSDLEIH
jgi:hypothetical protein